MAENTTVEAGRPVKKEVTPIVQVRSVGGLDKKKGRSERMKSTQIKMFFEDKFC